MIHTSFPKSSRTSGKAMNKSKAKSIALVVNTLSSGGAEHVVANLSRYLSEAYNIDIILNSEEPPGYAYCGNILSLGMPAGADRSSARYQLTALSRRTRLLKKLKSSGRYAAVISFSDNTNLSNVLSGSNGCKTIVSVRYSLAGKEKTDGKVSAVRRKILRKCCRDADAVVSCSEEIGDMLIAEYGLDPMKRVTIYNGVETDQIQAAAAEPLFPEPKGEDEKWIITLGRLTRQKGQWHLLRAVKHLRESGMNVRLAILGDGEMRTEFENMCMHPSLRDAVKMPGWVNNPYGYLKSADAAVFPSLYEGFSNAILETLACGTPCVSTDHRTGARELLAPDTDYREKVTDAIEYADYGVLVPVCGGEAGDIDAPLSAEEELLAEAVKEVLTNDARNKNYREAGLKRASELGIEKIAQQWIGLIESCGEKGM